MHKAKWRCWSSYTAQSNLSFAPAHPELRLLRLIVGRKTLPALHFVSRNCQLGLLVMPVALPACLLTFFAVIQYFQNAFGRGRGRRIQARQVDDDFLPTVRDVFAADQDGVGKFRDFTAIDLMWDKTAGPKRPQGFIDLLGLLRRIGQHVRKMAAAVDFLDEFAGKVLALLLVVRRQHVEADFGERWRMTGFGHVV